jgi:hypothetical protein
MDARQLYRCAGRFQVFQKVSMSKQYVRLLIAFILLFSLFKGKTLFVDAKNMETARQIIGRSTDSGMIFLPLISKDYRNPPLWRFGASKGQLALTEYDSFNIASMRFGWYVDLHATANAPRPYGIEYVPTVRVKQLKLAEDGFTKVKCRVGPYYVNPPEYAVEPTISEIQTIASNHPGMTWLIGNEIERVDSGIGFCSRQDEITPELYAQAYHEIYYAIKSVDPTAQVANGSMVEFTALRQEYLDRIWAKYLDLYQTTMPVDVWNMHPYVLPENSCSAFPTNCWGAEVPAGLSETSGEQYSELDQKDFLNAWDQIVSFRTWMKDHGQQDKPLIISEYGVLFPAWSSCGTYPDTTSCPFAAEEVRDQFMYPSFNTFLNHVDATIGYPADGDRLVQRWNWFSVDYDDGKCEDGLFYEYSGGALFQSGLGPKTGSKDCSFPTKGISSLGTYWMQYVNGLP